MTTLIVDEDQGSLLETATATFSPCRTYRYALTRVWDVDRPLAVFLMLNPSVADAFRLDPTLKRCAAFAHSWRAGGFLIHNLFGLRSTDPRGLYSHPDPIGPDNDQVIANTFRAGGPAVGQVICGWGVHGAYQNRGRRVEQLLRDRGVQPVCLGVTKDGHPKHPLYLAKNTAATPYGPA